METKEELRKLTPTCVLGAGQGPVGEAGDGVQGPQLVVTPVAEVVM